jgi:hypothetical protein
VGTASCGELAIRFVPVDLETAGGTGPRRATRTLRYIGESHVQVEKEHEAPEAQYFTNKRKARCAACESKNKLFARQRSWSLLKFTAENYVIQSPEKLVANGCGQFGEGWHGVDCRRKTFDFEAAESCLLHIEPE